jgi:fimbrial isopeptide formation D2 family protein/LPXTG-motif cell wall-anchored protein
MKQAKKVWYLLSALFLTLPVFISVLGTTVYAEDNASNAQIVIHKKKMTDLPNPLIQNSGKEMREFDQYQGLAEVTFRIYNVTSEFYAQRAAGATVEAAKQAVQGLTPGAPVAEGTTDADGNMTVNVPKQQKGKDAVYTIKEEPKSGVVAAANLVIAFPVYEMIKQSDGSYKYGSEELSTVHVYPKNVVSNDGSLHVKKVGTAENESLNGAEFVLSKSEGSPSTTKYIQGVKDGLHTWTTDKGQAKHFVTGKSYGIGEDDFTESEENTGELTVKNLEVGAYILEEVKAPNNAELIADQTKTPFTIEADNQTPVEKTVKNDTSNVEKTTPNLNGKDVAIGEKIKYEIAVNIPLGIADKEGNANKYNKFNLVDTHDEALTFDNTPSGETAYALYDGETVIAPGNYQVTEQTNGFTVAVDPAFIPSLTPGGTLKFVYFMHLNEKADPTKGFKNEANVDNGHTNDQTPPTVEVVTGGKRFIKVDGDVSSTQALAGAAFVVRDQDSEQANYLKVDEAAKTTTWVANKEDATTFTTEADGLVVVTGLKYGVYYLEETAAPENYVLLTNRIQFTVDEQSYGTTEELVAPEKVPNKHKGTLPSTGGKGIYLYLGSGALILLVVGLYFMKRKESR